MGSRARNSTRAPARSAKRRPKPRDESPAAEQSEPTDVLTQLQETHSILAVAARALDEISDPHWLDAKEPCGTEDVAVIVRLGIQKLDEAREALDLGPAGDAP
jgi:hypothetical protein